jgi:PAS domain-containing protein
LNYADSLGRDLIARIIPIGSNLSEPLFYELLHLYSFHASVQISAAATQLMLLSNIETQNFVDNSTVVLIFALIFVVVNFVYIFWISTPYDNAFDGAMTLFKRVTPTVFFENKRLENFLLQKDDSLSDAAQMTKHEKIINTASNPIFLLKKFQQMEAVNLAGSKEFGYSPEQIIGPSYVQLVVENEHHRLSKKFNDGRHLQTSSPFIATMVNDSNHEMSAIWWRRRSRAQKFYSITSSPVK